MKKIYRSVLAAALVTGMVLPMAACSKNNKNGSTSPENGNGGTDGSKPSANAPELTRKEKGRIIEEGDAFFNANIAEMKVNVPNGKEILYTEFTSAYAVGERVLSNVHIEFKKPAEVEAEMYKLNLDNEAEWDRYNKICEEYSTNSLQLFDLEGNNLGTVEIENGAEFTSAFALEDGEILVVTGKLDLKDCSTTPKLFVLSATGEKVRDINIDIKEPLNDVHVYVASNGNILLAATRQIFVLDPQGKLINKIENQDLNGQLFCSDGKWYAVMPKYESDSYSALVQELKVGTGKLVGDPIKVDDKIFSLKQGVSDCFLMNTNGIEKYDMTDGSSTMVFNWKDTDINSANLKTEGGRIESEDSMVFFKMEYNEEEARTAMDQKGGVGNRMSVVKITRADKNPHAGKEVLRLGVDGIDDSLFLDQIIAYNTNPENHARVEIFDYSANSSDYWDITGSTQRLAESAGKLTLDLLSGTAPDILVGFSEVSQFNNDNTLLDLKTFLDNDDTINKDDYFTNIISAFETDGKLFSLPITYTIDGMAVNSSFKGAKEKWTFADLDAVAAAVPDDVQAMQKIEYKEMLTRWMYAMTEKLVDNVNQKVNFESDEFKAMLEAVKKYGEPENAGSTATDGISDMPLSSTGHLNDDMLFLMGMVASCNTSLRSLDDYAALVNNNYGANVIFTGYPSKEGMGMTAFGEIAMSITKTASNPELAWEFIRSFLGEDVQRELSFNMQTFPVSKKAFYTNCTTEIKVSEKFAEDYRKSSGNEQEYKPNVLTQADADKLASLISSVETSKQIDNDVLNIVLEEAAAFFAGQRTIDDVCKNIQNRTTLIVQER
ncbi:MAG: extracellular solute-binding protein [Clostridiales bacterium]|nr:extracellular solute-binding protein [Clostridiales bacterium]